MSTWCLLPNITLAANHSPLLLMFNHYYVGFPLSYTLQFRQVELLTIADLQMLCISELMVKRFIYWYNFRMY